MVTTIFDEMDARMKEKLTGISVEVDGALQVVPVVYAYPEEWFSQTLEEQRKNKEERKYPIIAFHRYLPEVDRLRFWGARTIREEGSAYNTVIEREPSFPVKLWYQIEVITEFTRHRNQLNIEMIKRMPMFGFGTTLILYPNTNEQRVFPFECIHVAEDKQPLGRFSEKRKFRDIYIYEISACIPTDMYEEYSRILDVGIDFYVVSQQNGNVNVFEYNEEQGSIKGKVTSDTAETGITEESSK